MTSIVLDFGLKARKFQNIKKIKPDGITDG